MGNRVQHLEPLDSRYYCTSFYFFTRWTRGPSSVRLKSFCRPNVVMKYPSIIMSNQNVFFRVLRVYLRFVCCCAQTLDFLLFVQSDCLLINVRNET